MVGPTKRGRREKVSDLSRLAIAAVCVFVWNVLLCCASAGVGSGVTVDDLVRRAQIPLAAISSDGRFVAYVVMRGNPLEDTYDVIVYVMPAQARAVPLVLAEYRLTPSEAFDETEDLELSAATLRWSETGILYYVDKGAGKERLIAWDSKSRKSHLLMRGHDRIELGNDALWNTPFKVTSTDFVDPPAPPYGHVVNNSWRMSDGYRFYGGFRNPKTGRWIRRQNWSSGTGAEVHLTPVERPSDRWDILPDEWKAPAPTVQTNDSNNSTIYETDQTPSPDGTRVAVVEDARLNLNQPQARYSSARIVVKHANDRQILTPFSRPRPALAILGWRRDSSGILFVSIGAQESTVEFASLNGHVQELYREPAELQIPGSFYDRRCQVVSADGRYAIFIRSTNVNPGELIRLDLAKGDVTVLAAPNAQFAKTAATQVRFYPIEDGGQDVWGRLYLPVGYRPGNRYPLVITQYISRPGYYAAVGDEIPILPLAAHGIAVFSMHSRELNQVSELGEFQLELDRVRRPLDAMKWIIGKLVTDGIVDPERVGIGGLSYGSEIAMYAYWKSDLFRAVSVATGSWDPTLMLFGGLGYAAYMERRGFPISRHLDSFRQWSELSAGLNARPDLPPLLVQSSDSEEVLSVPTWFQLRRVNANVEWYEYPNEGHVKRSPANKWWVFHRNLDWFRYWLKNEEDSDPSERENYRRWGSWRPHTRMSGKQIGAPARNSSHG
ncbi:MAG TPA: prolyl oligopeptidase family serine peptidase [Steroidobacteraceae bacterium]|jgi:hypothetical protein|nr:prolyl oligopeptidase family serine peptidase [Steroidobacteraceae bacterium]